MAAAAVAVLAPAKAFAWLGGGGDGPRPPRAANALLRCEESLALRKRATLPGRICPSVDPFVLNLTAQGLVRASACALMCVCGDQMRVYLCWCASLCCLEKYHHCI